MDQEIFSEVVSGRHDILASESTIIFYLYFSFDQNEESRVMKAIELQLVELESMLPYKNR